MAEHGNGKRKCAHDQCKCMVPQGQAYCSSYCAAPEDADTPPNLVEAGCKCGHAECRGMKH